VDRVPAVAARRKLRGRITAKGVGIVAHMRKVIATDLAGILSSMDEEVADTVERAKRATDLRMIA
jgi:hypothetical protein